MHASLFNLLLLTRLRHLFRELSIKIGRSIRPLLGFPESLHHLALETLSTHHLLAHTSLADSRDLFSSHDLRPILYFFLIFLISNWNFLFLQSLSPS